MSFAPDCKLVGEVRPAVNHDERPEGRIDMLLMHYTGMPDDEEAVERLTSADSKVSCHYFVHQDGCVLQFVPEERRAWHAGVSNWHGVTDNNARSIGIEIANPGHEHGYRAFPDKQIESVIVLSKDILARRDIPSANVVAHSDIAPMRKEDPGELFPWKLLHENGIGHWVEPEPVAGGRFFQQGDAGQPVEALQTMLSAYGYGLEINGAFDELTHACVTAFQRHFRQERVDGVADGSTITTLHHLLRALPGAPSA